MSGEDEKTDIQVPIQKDNNTYTHPLWADEIERIELNLPEGSELYEW